MRHHPFFTWVLSFLLVGLGFLLGHYYALSNGFLPQREKVALTAPALLSARTGVSEHDPVLITVVTEESSVKEEEEGLLFPSRVGGLHMDRLISGKEALEHAQRIHGENAPLERVFIPYYSSRDEQVTVWVLEIASTYEAKKHMERINERMAESREENSYSSFYLQDTEINYLQSCNINNYYYRKNNNIYWLSMVTSDPIPLFLRFYEHF